MLADRGLKLTYAADEGGGSSGESGKGPTVAVRFPVDELNTGVKGVPVLTRTPQHVAKTKLDDVRAAAGSAQVGLDITEGS